MRVKRRRFVVAVIMVVLMLMSPSTGVVFQRSITFRRAAAEFTHN